ncbi:hypothetical protein A4G20_09410 [Pasteurellaceae bacterium RH1A]|nr:hypothetical protein A4G20_09410 [Pasteurellaceae bacterium RH1A]
MKIFSQLKQALSQTALPDLQGKDYVQLQVQAKQSLSGSELLGWLGAKSAYPHFFWQQREDECTLLASGAVEAFSSLASAQAFSQAHGLALVGGLQFNNQASFILPRLLLVKKGPILTACLTLKASEIASIEDFLADFEELASLQTGQNTLLNQHALCNFERWQANIGQAIQGMAQKAFNKVVLANATELTFAQPLCPYSLLNASQAKNPHSYHFLWAENKERAFIGSSPERLYARTGHHLQTEALAGTVAVGENEAQSQANADWLLHDLKNSYENWLVVEEIQENLVELVKDIEVSDLQIKRLSLVQHLYRSIQAHLEPGVQDNQILAHLHPTAAVAGIPYQSAFDFIQAVEPFERGWYAGTLGYFSPQAAEFCVTIRSAQLQANQARVYAGAGIVEGSEPETEWREIERKALAMIQLFNHNH